MQTRRKFKDNQSKITSDDIDNCTDVKQLGEIKMTLMENLINAKTQLETVRGKAAASGEYSDPNWYARLNSYHKVLGFLHQRCQLKERELKSLKNEERNIQHYFMLVAKDVLSEKKYYSILSESQKRKDEQDKLVL